MLWVITMEKMTKYAKFNYTEQDQDLIEGLEEYLNEHVEEVFAFFDSSLPRTIVNISIIPTKKEYDEIIKKRRQTTEDIPSWVIGNYYNGTIEYVSLHDYKNTSHAFPPEKYSENLEYYKKTIIHEYVHFVTGEYLVKNRAGDPPKYLNEGIAAYLSHQRDGKKPSFIYSLDDILNSRTCYEGWYLLTKYIIEQKGKDYFLMLLKNNIRSKSEASELYEEAKSFYDSLDNN